MISNQKDNFSLGKGYSLKYLANVFSQRTQYPFLENTLSLSTEKLALKNEGLIFFCTFIYD